MISTIQKTNRRNRMMLKLSLQFFAHKKGVGSTKNGRDSESKRLGVKKADGQAVVAGNIIVRRRHCGSCRRERRRRQGLHPVRAHRRQGQVRAQEQDAEEGQRLRRLILIGKRDRRKPIPFFACSVYVHLSFRFQIQDFSGRLKGLGSTDPRLPKSFCKSP